MNNNFWRRGALALALAGTALPGCHKEERHEEVDFCIKCGDDRKLEEISRECHDLLDSTLSVERISVTGRVDDDENNAVYSINDGLSSCSCRKETAPGMTKLSCSSQFPYNKSETGTKATYSIETDGSQKYHAFSLSGDQTVLPGRTLSVAPDGACTEIMYGGVRSNQTPESQRACQDLFTANSRKLNEIFEQLREKHDKQ